VVLAVNAWNEPADKLRRFVEQKKLTHRILLGGAAVAGEGYGVEGIPVTIWIDRDGRIAAREVGFAPGQEGRLERITRDLL